MGKINIKEIRRVLRHIKRDLRRLNMGRWGILKGNHIFCDSRIDKYDYPACGTKACMAGWTVLLNTPKKKWNKLFDLCGQMDEYETKSKAAKILGLSKDQADSMFMGDAIYAKPSRQYKTLLRDINKVLEEAGMKERV